MDKIAILKSAKAQDSDDTSESQTSKVETVQICDGITCGCEAMKSFRGWNLCFGCYLNMKDGEW